MNGHTHGCDGKISMGGGGGGAGCGVRGAVQLHALVVWHGGQHVFGESENGVIIAKFLMLIGTVGGAGWLADGRVEQGQSE